MVTDIDQDGLISREDMYQMLDMIVEEPLKESIKKKVVDEVRNPSNSTQLPLDHNITPSYL